MNCDEFMTAQGVIDFDGRSGRRLVYSSKLPYLPVYHLNRFLTLARQHRVVRHTQNCSPLLFAHRLQKLEHTIGAFGV